MTASSPAKKYFNIHTNGIGYLNRIREVPAKKGRRAEPFLACSIAALNGPSDAVEYRYYDCKVSGRDAAHLVRKCKEAVDAKRKVLIGFRLGDPWTDIFTYEKGPKQGETGVSEKGRLLFISWIKIDGKLVYKAASKPTAGEGAEDADVASIPVEEDPSFSPGITDAEASTAASAEAA